MITQTFGTGRSTHYSAGRAMFFAGKMPQGITTVKEWMEKYEELSHDAKLIADGWFDARDDVRLHFIGELPPSTRPMQAYALPMTGFADAIEGLPARKRGMPKAFRRKGRNAVVIHTNGGGTKITWNNQVFLIDAMSADEKAQVVGHVFASAYSVGYVFGSAYPDA
jgi:hypothetical protein